MLTRTKDITRFWSKVPDRPEEHCWDYQGFITWNGYGQFFVVEDGKRCNRFAHRISWELSHKVSVPEGLQVRHSCDNRRCVNPIHLVVGTCQDNTNDRISKGRHSHGEQCRMSILTEAQVVQILEARFAGVSLSTLAREYRVSISSVWGISVGRCWKHVYRRVADRMARNVEGTNRL